MAKFFTPIQTKAPANAETFNAPLAELDTQIDSNASQLAEQLALIQAHAAALQQQLTAIQTNAAAIATQGELVEELAADSTVHDQQIEALDGRLDTAEADIQSQGTAIDGLTSRIGTAETDVNGLKTAMDGLDDDLTGIETDVSGLKADMTDVKGRMTTAEGDIDNLEADMTATKGRVTTAEGDIDNLEADMTATQGRLTTAEGDIDSLETDVDGLNTRVTDLEQAPGYTLPAATASDLGGVKVGDGLEIDQDGVLSASGGGGSYAAICTTAANVVEKTITIPGIMSYYDGLTVDIVLTAGHTATGTMKFNINGLGSKTVLYYPYSTTWITIHAVYYDGQFRTNSYLAGGANSITPKPNSVNYTEENLIPTTLSAGLYYLTVNDKKCIVNVIYVSLFGHEYTLTYLPQNVNDTPVIKKRYGLYKAGSGWTYTSWVQIYPAI